ncbi:MAG TPA: Crp/Fnr family transcriptional regulator [Micropepsaceae bacterium]|nr:Crp/Fnr family transcriptional regulator [Micropepsaceae bacterium]
MGSRHEESQNQLLAAMPSAELAALRPHLKQVTLEHGSQLKDSGERIQYAYFPLSGMVSLLSVMSDGRAVKTAVVGHEGGVGIQSGLGIANAHSRAIVEVQGAALRAPALQFHRIARDSEKLRDLLVRYREFCFAQMQQSVACNALHGAEERLARWLLHSSDIVGSHVLPLTQEFLAQVLGVRRTTVTGLAQTLLQSGVIDYRRGRIEIRNRDQLKRFACECYDVLQRLPPQYLRSKR